ncbi:MAG TPA: DMT family transporter [Planctomycetota bacterium]|nr:DMT family transporter [Planctomycetota bacterium]
MASQPTAVRRRGGVPALFLATALWGVTFTVIGGAVQGRDTGDLLIFLTLRFSLATLAFLPWLPAILRQARGRGAAPWIDAAKVGVLLFASFLLQTLGLVHTTPSRSAFVTSLSVLFVPFIAAWLARRKPSRLHLYASLLALAGLAVVLAPDGRPEPNLGDWLTFACAVVFAFEIVVLEGAAARSPLGILALGQIATVALLAGLCLPFCGVGLADLATSVTGDGWPELLPAVAVTGVLCTTVALGLVTWGQARLRAETVAILFALEPLWAALFEWLWTGSGLTPIQWFGGALVIVAVCLAARPSR